jgi:hypothetical protein
MEQFLLEICFTAKMYRHAFSKKDKKKKTQTFALNVRQEMFLNTLKIEYKPH